MPFSLVLISNLSSPLPKANHSFSIYQSCQQLKKGTRAASTSSNTDRKKRAVDEEDEATATETKKEKEPTEIKKRPHTTRQWFIT